MVRKILIIAIFGFATLLGWNEPGAAADVRNVTPKQAQDLLNADATVRVLDIRTPREFRAGHISGAANINFYSRSFYADIAKLRPQRHLPDALQTGRTQWCVFEGVSGTRPSRTSFTCPPEWTGGSGRISGSRVSSEKQSACHTRTS